MIQIQHVDGRQMPVFIRIHETITESDHFFTAILEDLSTETLLRSKLEEGAQMLRAMADSNPSGIFISDATVSRNVYVNDRLCQIYGASREELLLPGAWQHFIHPEDAPLVYAEMQKAMASQQSGEVVHRVVDKSGRTSWVHVGARAYMKDGAFHGFIGSVVDITQYKMAELEIESERARMYEITRMLPASVKYFDAEGRYIFVNAAVERTWKRPVAEFAGKHYSEILPAEMLRTVEPYMRRAFAGEEVRFEVNLPREGKMRRFQTTYIPHKRHGAVIGMTASAIDMTEIQEKNDRLQIYEQMIEGMSEGVVLAGLDVPETIFYSNPAFARILGRQSFEILGYSLARFIADLADPASFARAVRADLEAKGSFRGEVALQDKGGRRVDVVLKARPLDLPDARAIL